MNKKLNSNKISSNYFIRHQTIKYMSYDLLSFLIKYNVLDKFIINRINHIFKLKGYRIIIHKLNEFKCNSIQGSIIFNKTIEGFDYWFKLHKLYENRNNKRSYKHSK